jgi:hypothetical protein
VRVFAVFGYNIKNRNFIVLLRVVANAFRSYGLVVLSAREGIVGPPVLKRMIEIAVV